MPRIRILGCFCVAMVPLLLVVLLALIVSSAEDQVKVSLPYLGDVLGDETLTLWTKRKVLQFRGLPYVLPPTGNRRFLPPVPFEESELDVVGKGFDARQNPRKCPQSRLIPELKAGNYTGDPEDCLYLNVFTPKLLCDDSNLLPVMMYISGGGLYEGSLEEFPPGYLLEKDVIVVVPQYRLGVLGFLSLQTDGIPGNVGFLDQLEALRWTKRNCRAFCGDEKRITVFGQSAGALSVALLHISPLVEPGLFQRAIMQSGSALTNWAVDEKPEVFASYLADVLRGCQPGNASCPARQERPDDEMVLRSASAMEIIEATNQLERLLLMMSGSITWSVGGKSAVRQRAGSKKYVLPETDLSKIPPEKVVPLIIGVTANDGSFITSGVYDFLSAFGNQDNPDFLRESLLPNLMHFINAPDPSGVLEDSIRHQYFGNVLDNRNVTFADVAPGITDLAGSVAFKGGAARTASLVSRAGQPVWLYSLRFLGKCSRFGYGEPIDQYPFSGGVAHSNDLLFLWPFYCPPPIPKRDENIVHMIVDLWTNFAANGKPSATGIDWPQVNNETAGPYLLILSDPQVAHDFVKNEFHLTAQQHSNLRKKKNVRRQK